MANNSAKKLQQPNGIIASAMAFEVVYQFSELWVPPRSMPAYLPLALLIILLIGAGLAWYAYRQKWFEGARYSSRSILRDFTVRALIALTFGLVVSSGIALVESRPNMAQADLLDKVKQGKVEQIEGYLILRPELRDADNRIVQQSALVIGNRLVPAAQNAPSFYYFLKQAGVLQNGQYARITHVKGNVVKVEIQR